MGISVLIVEKASLKFYLMVIEYEEKDVINTDVEKHAFGAPFLFQVLD